MTIGIVPLALIIIASNLLIELLAMITRRYLWLKRHRKQKTLGEIFKEIEEFGNNLSKDADVLVKFGNIDPTKIPYNELVDLEIKVRSYYDKYVKR